MNIFTGDNGLGKSFLLDVAWWVLTGTWVHHPALPREDVTGEPEIEAFFDRDTQDTHRVRGQFDFIQQTWSNLNDGFFSSIPNRTRSFVSDRARKFSCPVLYGRADGGFSAWDPFRNYRQQKSEKSDVLLIPDAYHFDTKSLWHGLRDGENILCNGLVHDWVTWQQDSTANEKTSPFSILQRVLKTLSHPNEPLLPGKPRKVFINDARKFPTLDLPHENIPVILASAGMQRILSFAYTLTWLWIEHLEAARLVRREPASNMVVLIDEIETHLHPAWQRRIVRALISVLEDLEPGIKPQLFLTTHAPLVLASMEPHFDVDRDKLFLFDYVEGNRDIEIRQIDNIKQGDAADWLESEVFELGHARSIEAEIVIDAANAFMRNDLAKLPPHLNTLETIDAELRRVLPAQHPWLPAWTVFSDKRRKAP